MRKSGRCSLKPKLEFADVLATLQTNIKIRIHKSIVDRVLDYCSYENFIPDDKEHYIVSFPFIENDYYYDIVLSFGDKCVCLESLHVREKMKQRIYDIASLYKK